MKFCITQYRNTYQAGVSLPLWKITRVKQFGPVFQTFEAAQGYLRTVKPRSN